MDRLAAHEIVAAVTKIYAEEDSDGRLPKLVWLIDALNQLEDEPWDKESRARPSEATWLPLALPPKLRVVITCLRGPFLDGLCSRFSLHPQNSILSIRELIQQQREAVIIYGC